MYTKTMLYEVHWGRVAHICVSKLTIIGSYNGLSPDRHEAIIETKSGTLLTGPLGTNFSEILIEIYVFSFKKMHLKMSSGKRRPFCLGLNLMDFKDAIWTYLAPVLFHLSLHWQQRGGCKTVGFTLTPDQRTAAILHTYIIQSNNSCLTACLGASIF